MQKPAPGLRKTRLYTPTYSQSHRYRVPGVFLIPIPGVSIHSFTPSSVNAGQELYRAVRGWGGSWHEGTGCLTGCLLERWLSVG